MAYSCLARITTTAFVIPGTEETCYHTTECRKSAARKITVDDGDAFMPICGDCFTKFQTKNLKTGSTWLGWFDCDYPPQAHIKGSRWYHETVKQGKTTPTVKSSPSPPTLSAKEVDILVEAMTTLTVEAPPLSEKEIVKQQIEEIEGWMRGEGKLKFKEQPKKLRDLLNLRARLKLLK